MTAPELAKLTADELLASATDMSLLPDTYPRELMQIRGVYLDELHRRAQSRDLACADRDSARDELAEMKALRDAAKSDHKEACRILRNYQTLAEERGREIKALIRERDELHRRAQANAQVQAERDEFDEELHTCRAIVGATSEHLHVDLEELVDKLRRTEADSRSWQELATARAQANDALRSHAETVRKERESRNRGGADDCFTDNARSRQRESEAIESILSLLAAPAASAIAAAPEAPAWRERLDEAERFMANPEAHYSDNNSIHGINVDLRSLHKFCTALREQVESHARRIEALERAANNKEAGK